MAAHGSSQISETSNRGLAYLRLIAQTRASRNRSYDRPDLAAALGLGGPTLVIAALALPAAVPSSTAHQAILWVLLVAAFAVTARVEFQGIAGNTTCSQPVFVAMLVCLPVWSVPAAVILGDLLCQPRDQWRSRKIAYFFVVVSWNLSSLGPAAVLSVAGVPDGRAASTAVFLLAWAAQFPLDAAVAMVRCRLGGLSLHRLAAYLPWAYLVESLLALAGWSATIAAGNPPRPLLLLALLGGPVLLVAILERDRKRHLGTALSVEQAYTAAERQARIDQLTGLGNRRAWDEVLAQVRRRVSAGEVGAVVVMADIDGLKPVNDALGHAAGDRAIASAGQALAEAVPGARLVARLGGDEFGAIVLCADDEVAALRAQVIVDVGRGLGRIPPVSSVPVSVSFGTSSCAPGADVDQCVQEADAVARQEKAAKRWPDGRC